MKYYHLVGLSGIIFLIQWVLQSLFHVALPTTIKSIIAVIQGLLLLIYVLPLVVKGWKKVKPQVSKSSLSIRKHATVHK